MVTLEYFDGNTWNFVSEWASETLAWISLGGDNFNYRVVNAAGFVLKQG